MATLKTVTLAAALIAGATSLAMAQNGPATGGEPPVAGGAAASNPTTGGSMGRGMAPAKTMHHKTMKKKNSKPQ
ncbi:MAG TPA: hypothetical protein VL048_03970 [Xanthobacteraceae bacterium]|jgi:hypothetical protein|nr:hypothetical protein [Xanthobacteraceae bacterium]